MTLLRLYEEVETTTRVVSIELYQRLSADNLPHQLKILQTAVLVSVPDREPQCLRWERIGHVRDQCRAPWCSACRKYEHEPEDCIPTYANRTTASLEIPIEGFIDSQGAAQSEVAAEANNSHKVTTIEKATRNEKGAYNPNRSRSAT